MATKMAVTALGWMPTAPDFAKETEGVTKRAVTTAMRRSRQAALTLSGPLSLSRELFFILVSFSLTKSLSTYPDFVPAWMDGSPVRFLNKFYSCWQKY